MRKCRSTLTGVVIINLLTDDVCMLPSDNYESEVLQRQEDCSLRIVHYSGGSDEDAAIHAIVRSMQLTHPPAHITVIKVTLTEADTSP